MLRSEKSLIRQIRQLSGTSKSAQSRSRIALGIGDDTAILRFPPGHEVLVTTDFSLEGVHFRRDWHPADSVGHRCLARGLSDIAAMGGQPVAAFLSLALPAHLPQKWVDGFLEGLLQLAKQHGVVLAGGDTAQSPGSAVAKILADIVVLGSVPQGKAIRRSSAKPGDQIYVTGSLGASAAVLAKMYAKPKNEKKIDPRKHPRHFYPAPRIALGLYLRKHKIASAMIDLSDGLSTDLNHICEESHVGAAITADLIPHREAVTLEQALHGGEDYELLFTAPAKCKVPRTIAGIPITRIGEIRRGQARISLLQNGRRIELIPQGWEHFKTS